MKDNPCRVLFVLGTMDIGGVQSGVMNFAKVIAPEEVQFDVLVHSSAIGYHEKAFSEYGNVYHIGTPEAKTKIGRLLFAPIRDYYFRRKLVNFLESHSNYDAIHSKSLEMSAAVVEAAKRCGIPVRIAQSHVDKPDRMNPISQWLYKWRAKRIEKAATCKLAVSEKAADLMFSKFGGRVIKNPTISLKRLNPELYSEDKHNEIILIQIGTYSKRKNQCFSLDILKALIDNGNDAALTFVGYSLDEPEYIHEVEKKVTKLGLDNSVHFLPKDADVPLLLSQSDYMLIPSLREGLPNVALESQAMGVPCFLSDTITKKTDCGLCTFLPLETGAEWWAEEIVEYRKKNGAEKRFVDMTMWDNETVCKEYIKIWRKK